MHDRIEKRVTGSVTDRLVRHRASPMSLDFRPAGDHALAHGWPMLQPGAPKPNMVFSETWQARFRFVSEDGLIDAVASGFNPRLGLHFRVPWALVFGHPADAAGLGRPLGKSRH